ncbi:hypothetical protein [Winogradskyella sp. MIT101101]|uniref:hypothetical protein n=1 Tax=Winogradskyella sp. MIT101101 TaxID=3098297 RepID=UPI00399C0062
MLYDSHGRPALQTLSAPIGTGFGLNETNFIKDDLNTSYTLSDFDEGNYIDDPRPVSSSSLLGSYYFDNGGYDFQDNTQYPFTRLVYSRLSPGNTKKVLGGNKVNGQWLQAYSFSMPAAQELSRPNAFGSSAYNDDRITKHISRDVNGVETVVFTDSEGNTLAVARSGNEGTRALRSTV